MNGGQLALEPRDAAAKLGAVRERVVFRGERTPEPFTRPRVVFTVRTGPKRFTLSLLVGLGARVEVVLDFLVTGDKSERLRNDLDDAALGHGEQRPHALGSTPELRQQISLRRQEQLGPSLVGEVQPVWNGRSQVLAEEAERGRGRGAEGENPPVVGGEGRHARSADDGCHRQSRAAPASGVRGHGGQKYDASWW